MIIYKDVVSNDEIVADTFKLKDSEKFPLVLWECDCRKYTKRVGGENFELAGANPSAEDAEEDDGGEGEFKMVHDIEDQFRLNWLQDEYKPSKSDFEVHLKKYLKMLSKRDARSDDWKKQAAGALKYILKNYDNFDVMMGESMNGEAMHVLIDFREDGVTPFATIWKDGLFEEKV